MDFNWLILMGGAQAGESPIPTLGFMALIFIAMYLLLIRPQRKKQKEHDKLLGELKKGDKVITTGGMFGTIFAINEDKGSIVIKIGDQTKLEFLKSSVAARVDN